MQKSIFLAILLFFAVKGFSTYQIQDYMIWNNDTFYFYESPLEQIDNIASKINAQKNKRIQYISSGCWRGFYAEWKLIDSILYLSNVYDCRTDKNINKIIEKVLGKKFVKGLLKADWVNGNIWCGKNLGEIFMLYLSVYKNDYCLFFDNGDLIQIKEYHHIPCIYANKENLTDYILDHVDWKSISICNSSRFRFSAELQIAEVGQIKEVKILECNDAVFQKEITKVLSQLPCWEVYFREGVIYNDEDYIENMEIYYYQIKKYIGE